MSSASNSPQPPDPSASDASLQYLYMTSTGWKSGNPHRIEIWFVALEERYYIVSEGREKSHWVQNVMRNPRLTFSVGEQHFTGTGRAVQDVDEPDLTAQVKALMDHKYGWSAGLIVQLTPDQLSNQRE
jgi:deazaflavin-dependent oxidoreductase (nitroreductase family)